MARFIEIRQPDSLPPVITLTVGDVLLLGASGGYVQTGGEVVQIQGPFMPGLMRNDGQVLSPMGAPNTVLLLARSPGRAKVAIVKGNPWYNPETIPFEIAVEP